MPRSALDTAEAKQAQMEALRGAGFGALKWGAAAAVLGGLGYSMSPIYRGLTIQFKVYVVSLIHVFISSCSAMVLYLLYIFSRTSHSFV